MAVRDILIVEDQALARMYLCSCVEKCADCRVAGSGGVATVIST